MYKPKTGDLVETTSTIGLSLSATHKAVPRGSVGRVTRVHKDKWGGIDVWVKFNKYGEVMTSPMALREHR